MRCRIISSPNYSFTSRIQRKSKERQTFRQTDRHTGRHTDKRDRRNRKRQSET